MNVEENDIDLIERFLDGTLNETELASFHQRMQEDPDFARFVDLRKAMPELWVEADQCQEIQEEMKQILQGKHPVRILWMPPAVFAIAASVVVLVGIALALTLTIGGGNELNERERIAVGHNDSIFPLKSEKPEVKAQLGKVQTDSLAGLQLLFPEDGMKYSSADSIRFAWRMAGDSASTFYLMDNITGKIVLQKEIKPEKTEFILPPNSLKPGTYYWFIGADQVKREIQIDPLRSP